MSPFNEFDYNTIFLFLFNQKKTMIKMLNIQRKPSTVCVCVI